MKLIAVLGSSRHGSVSRQAAEAFMEGAKEAGYEVSVCDANHMNLKGCTGCGACKKQETFCVQNDDLKAYFEELNSADAILVTAPNYMSQICGTMINFMNRHYCIRRGDRSSRLTHPVKIAGIFSQGAPEARPEYQSVYQWYLQVFEGMGMTRAGLLTIGGDSNMEEKLNEARQMGRNL